MVRRDLNAAKSALNEITSKKAEKKKIMKVIDGEKNGVQES